MNRCGFWAHGRHVVIEIDKELDEAGHFGVHVEVDDQPWWEAYLAPHESEDKPAHPSEG